MLPREAGLRLCILLARSVIMHLGCFTHFKFRTDVAIISQVYLTFWSVLLDLVLCSVPRCSVLKIVEVLICKS